MALFSMRVQVIKRSAGRSSVAAAAYRSGSLLHDERTGLSHDYRRKKGVEHCEIMLPENAPDWVRDLPGREALWNAVEAAEKRKDAQVARELYVSIPRELDPATRIRVVRDFVQKSFVSRGMIADLAFHSVTASDQGENCHAHIMLTMRPALASGFGPKSRHEHVPDPSGRTHPDGRPILVSNNKDSWNCAEYYERCREDWENIANRALAEAGSAARIDRRSLLERGIARLPEPWLGAAYYMRDIYGAMKERFGQYLAARHAREVERAATDAFGRIGNGSTDPAEAAHVTARFYGWFERQLARLDPERAYAHQGPAHEPPPPSPDLER